MASDRLIQIPDPVHGYIPVEPRFLDIIDTPEFQRLRSIEQGSFRPVFPGARHDRFIHSLGTYHLATRFVEHFFKNLRRDVKGIRLTAQMEEDLKLTFRYAALLHDVGHAPFSHTTEDLFKEKKDPATGLSAIWTELCRQISLHAAPADHLRFRDSTKKAVGAAHEIMSATILLRSHNTFTAGSKWKGIHVDPELAARMIIGYPYSDKDTDAAGLTDEEIQLRGIKNCLIGLLNSSTMDVDRMDYLARDTQMSGYTNAPVDLDCLARSVTAVKNEKNWLVPAFRDQAIPVIDTMFHAKLSHDIGVLALPAGAYDAALREHCIRTIDAAGIAAGLPSYISTVFTVDALSNGNVTWNGKRYRLLCDADILSDLDARDGAPFDELLTRLPGKRRTAAWRSYYEFRHIFTYQDSTTADDVYKYFQPLLQYMKDNHIFVFNADSYARIVRSSDPLVRQTADFLKTFLTGLTTDPVKKAAFNVVLLERSHNLTMKIDPADVRIVFPGSTVPPRPDARNYSTYAELTGITKDDKRLKNYFYLYRHGGLGHRQLARLRDRVAVMIQARRAQGLM